MLCCCHLKILHHFIFKLGFVKLNLIAPRAQNSSGASMCESSEWLKQVQGLSVLCLQLSKQGRWQPWETMPSIWSLLFLQTQHRGNGVFRNMNNQGTLSYPSLLVLLSCKPATYAENSGTEGKEKTEKSIVLFPFSHYSSISWKEIESIGRICVYQEVE